MYGEFPASSGKYNGIVAVKVVLDRIGNTVTVRAQDVLDWQTSADSNAEYLAFKLASDAPYVGILFKGTAKNGRSGIEARIYKSLREQYQYPTTVTYDTSIRLLCTDLSYVEEFSGEEGFGFNAYDVAGTPDFDRAQLVTRDPYSSGNTDLWLKYLIGGEGMAGALNGAAITGIWFNTTSWTQQLDYQRGDPYGLQEGYFEISNNEEIESEYGISIDGSAIASGTKIEFRYNSTDTHVYPPILYLGAPPVWGACDLTTDATLYAKGTLPSQVEVP